MEALGFIAFQIPLGLFGFVPGNARAEQTFSKYLVNMVHVAEFSWDIRSPCSAAS
jgi:hypothetical protein